MQPAVVLQALSLVVATLATLCHGSQLIIEHSVDSKTFTAGGYIEGDLLRTVASEPLLLSRIPLTDAEQAMLKSLIEQDGFYTLRVSGGAAGGAVLMASVRASCLTGPDAEEQVVVQVNDVGVVVGLSYSLHSSGCGASSAPSSYFKIPKGGKVFVRRPIVVPSLQLTESETFAATVKGVSLSDFAPTGGAGAKGAAQQQQPGGPAGSAQQAGGGQQAEEAKPDDRTWWQKNWLFVIGGVMMVINVLGKVAGPQAAQGGGARPAVGGGGGGARR